MGTHQAFKALTIVLLNLLFFTNIWKFCKVDQTVFKYVYKNYFN